MRSNSLVVGKFSFIAILLTLAFNSLAQNREKLEKLSLELNRAYIEDSIAVSQYLELNGGSRRFINSQGQIVELVKVLDGHLIYKKEFNAGAAVTTRTNLLYEGGGLGLSLSGTGLTVGVWDGGQANKHVEFGTRVSGGDGSGNISDHATHVMGTILAKGINPAAKGMAYNALGKSYLWDNDLAEMTTFAWGGGLVSNHSYGTVLGWDGGLWNGNTTISENEDYRFGFYGFDAPAIDNIARNAPYYLMVKSAGNDRNDSGPTNPPDGNMGTGFDSIGPGGCAKNNLTVGAVQKLITYTGPQDVEMSSFSGWGPTDDGRIKPDIVGAGVNLFSTSSAGEESYTTKSGTSMSAPNVTGSIILLQEHFSNLNSGLFMRSSTLKGLIIHTAREAGEFDGPDYSFGWGLLDDAAAANHISEVDQENYILMEEQLLEGQEFAMEIYPQKDTKVTATICWIDPTGPTSATALDPVDLRLVNDLDMRIVDDAGNEYQPWILNPALPYVAASKGDNFRDNVEQVEFIAPVQRKYTLKINHKNTLQEGMQEFSLLLTQSSIDDGLTSYYYIGEDGNWDDPNNWSLRSGGDPADALPDAGSNVIFDENSFQASNSLTLSSDVAVHSLSWFALEGNTLDLNQNIISVAGNIILDKKLANPIGNGTLMLNSEEAETSVMYTANSVFENLDLVVNSTAGQVEVHDSLKLHSLVFNQGDVSFVTDYMSVDDLIINGDASSQFDISGLKIDIGESLQVQSVGELVSDILSAIQFNSPGQATLSVATSTNFNGYITVNEGSLVISGDFRPNLLEVIAADVIIQNSLEIGNFNVVNGSFLTIAEGETLSVNEYISFSSVGPESNGLKSSSSNKASLQLNNRSKYCFTNLEISNVDLLGESVVSVGSTSVITNSVNWLGVGCGDILFAEFQYQDICAGGVTKFTDVSSGEIENRVWEVFDGNALIHTTSDSIFYFSFDEVGEYQVKISVSNAQQDNDVLKDVIIIENHLEVNEIVDNQSSMASRKSSDNYQWFINNQPIDGALERVYILPNENFGEVMYYVVTSDDVCNRKSNNLIKIVTDIDDILEYDKDISIYPNPTSGSLDIKFNEPGDVYKLTITGVDGRTFFTDSVRSANKPITLDLNNLNEGIYILSLTNGERQILRRIIIEK